MAAAGLLVFAFAALLTGCVLAIRAWLRAIRRHCERRRWNGLVARHAELDRELEQIWQHR